MPDLYDALRERGCIDPLLVHVAIATQIGKECPFPTIKAMADHYGLHPEQLRLYIRGLRQEPEPKLLKAFGLEKIVLYAPAQTPSSSKEVSHGG